ncbi:MAG: polyprenol monophosphomannose synthase [Planctomycetota bacterium]|nr:polyprenol monophosphomannose synthase [Planctomycetota bacterium]MDI6788160.1 polyprenol monophosphomannose synthase [Planctomycetota bacterium]
MKILVVIPTYNEKENIQKLAEKILNLNLNLDLLIVDDNSPDGTGEIADKLAREYSPVKVVHRSGKPSEGLSRRDGYRYALMHNYDYIIEMDADLSHDPEEIPKFLEQIREWDVVIGSRFINGSKQVGRNIFRRSGSHLANLYIRKMLNIKGIHDCASGYRCYRSEVLERIDLDDISFTGPAALIKTLFRCCQSGFKIKEIPITYQERQSGKSKKSSPGFIIEALWTVFKLKCQN